MLADSGPPKQLWAEAMLTFTHCKNRSLHSSINGKIPEQLQTGNVPSVSHLKSFGCRVYATKQQDRKKLVPKANPFIFIGYEYAKKAYRLFHPPTKLVHISRDVRFVESDFSARVNATPSTSIENQTKVKKELGTVQNTACRVQPISAITPAPSTRFRKVTSFDSSEDGVNVPESPTPQRFSTDSVNFSMVCH